jgi:hypothetical protein
MEEKNSESRIREYDSQTLYRFWHKDILLYVGISQGFLGRMDTHERTKNWFEYCERVTIEHYPSRQLVLAAEEKAIKSERPLFNVVHNTKYNKNLERLKKLESLVPEDYFYVLPATPEERRVFIESLKTDKGGYTRLTLDKLKVKYPPNNKWRKNLILYGSAYAPK